MNGMSRESARARVGPMLNHLFSVQTVWTAFGSAHGPRAGRDRRRSLKQGGSHRRGPLFQRAMKCPSARSERFRSEHGLKALNAFDNFLNPEQR